MNELISDATKRNWKKLNTDESERLTKRANKRMSLKNIIPGEYYSDINNIEKINVILSETNELSKEEIIFSLAVNLLKGAGIYEKPHVKNVLSEYNIKTNKRLSEISLPGNEDDLLGLIYQHLLTEGEKNIGGSYYTPFGVVKKMTEDFDFSNGETFFDPCCGSGAFLLSVGALPNCLYAMDKDPVAVMIAKVNLLIKFRDKEFKPQVFCGDFLEENDWEFGCEAFDYIATNPPWGAISGGKKESFSAFFTESFKRLKKDGIIRFLMPESVLNVKKHKDVREFILNNGGILNINVYERLFSGVLTGYVDIGVKNSSERKKFIYCKKGEEKEVNISAFELTQNKNFVFLGKKDEKIIKKVKSKGRYYLDKSVWALGIVTGDNQKRLKKEPKKGLEEIYTGKEVIKYLLKPAKNYISYEPEKFQQSARKEYYRAEEKLIYKFISDKPVFAYDNKKRLVLNSANILIPNIPGMSQKTVMAFLNSELFTYLYKNLFGELKILKGNLEQLPFPEITETDNEEISCFIDEILTGNKEADEKIQKKIYKIYGISEDEVEYISNAVTALAKEGHK